MELVTKNIDLARAVIELTSSKGPPSVLNTGIEIVQWLARERINKSEYIEVMELTRAFAFPNDHGLEIRDKILESEAKISRLGGLHLLRSASLGRWMAFLDDYCWLVTAVTTLSGFYTLDHISDVLSWIALDKKPNTSSTVNRLRYQR
jgi:hypothetical protein